MSRSARAQGWFGFSSAAELWLAGSIFGAGVLLKFWAAFHYRFDSDESQHLHVVWAWTQGLLQYRDAFDNHMPLFQLLCAPILALMGEHASVLFWMRLLMIPLYLVSAWAIFQIGAAVFSRRIGAWAAVLVSCFPAYYFCTTEFRTDDLWNVFWLLSLLVLVRGPLTLRRALGAGVLFGLAFGVSMKSTVILLGLLVALGGAAWLVRPRLEFPRLYLAKCVAAFAFATALIPLVIMAFFAAKGLWPEFRYGVFEHNLILHRSAAITYRRMLFLPVLMPIVLLLLRKFFERSPDREATFARAFVLLFAPSYYLVLTSFWRHITRQDYLPFAPLAALGLAAVLFSLSASWERVSWLRRSLVRLPAAAYVVLLLATAMAPQFLRLGGARREVALVRNVLALAKPGDYVFDLKGETIFRLRSSYLVLESLTMDRLKKGLIADDLRQRCVETRTCIAVVGGRMPKRDGAFVSENYLLVAPSVRVAGLWLNPAAAGQDIEFNITIPAAYELIALGAPVTGLLDGKPYEGARLLAPGKHDFRPATAEDRVAVIWAQAADRNFTPFHYMTKAGHG